MNKQQLNRYRNLLDSKIQALIGNADRTVGRMSTGAQSFPDPTDRASLETDRNFTLRIRDRERKLIYKLRKAMSRIEDGTYGYCDVCGQPITSKRLQARPEAEVCIECKLDMEERERLTRTFR